MNVAPAKILLVDDQPLPLITEEAVLESAGYAVRTAASSAEALQAFVTEPIDLVITDHLLPDATGAEIAAEMKRLKPDVPIVIWSGVADLPEGIEHADLFLSKLEPPAVLLDNIRRLLQQRVPHQ